LAQKGEIFLKKGHLQVDYKNAAI